MILNLFVWEVGLNEFVDGIMVALAPDIEQARELLHEKLSCYEHSDVAGVEDDLQQEPRIYTQPHAFTVWILRP